ncbi:MAG: DUF1553 domain-containing protein [Pirellulales bacterium]
MVAPAMLSDICRPLLAIAFVLSASCRFATAADAPVSFARDVLPILAKNCFACHGPDPEHREAELRLDQRDAATVELPSGTRAVVPGRPEASEIWRRITSDDVDLLMPPAKHGKPLTNEQRDILRRWLQEGATYAKHWSFVPPVAVKPPQVDDVRWNADPIDAFIAARLNSAELQPNEEADPAVLCRRVHLDLVGLPPTAQEAEAFEEAYRRDGERVYVALVDRLLASPHFGERWARPWLDLARYADSRGYGSDPLRLNIWPYRDWVIGALNRDLPFDQFTIEQLAGDLLPAATEDQRVATAFHRNTMTNTEGGTDDEEFRVAAVNDRTHVTMQAWMGLTMGCAKCHAHKYDPISQEEYYRVFAIFNETEDADRPDEAPTLALHTVEETAKTARRELLVKELAAAKDEVARLEKEKPVDDAGKKTLAERQARVKELEKQIAALKPLEVPVMRELAAEKRRPTHVLVKGNFLVKGALVEPSLPTAFHKPAYAKASPDRLALAQWLIAADNPLTARVAANRVWAQLFGIGLVETEEDFGVQGALPSHPELLDTLALAYRDGALPGAEPWSTKSLIKRIVLTRTYRQSSKTTEESQRIDPRNRLVSHAPRFRLEAETVRDQALAIAGLLSRRIGGPSVFPPQPAGLWQAAFNGERTWTTSGGDDKYRRGLYTFWRRTVPYPSLATFDAPSREICAVRRIRTNTPLQALVTWNDPVYVEAAQAFAGRIVREGSSSPDERSRWAWRSATGRAAEPEQLVAIVRLYEAERTHYRADLKAAAAMAGDAQAKGRSDDDLAAVAAWTVVANMLLNLDAVLTRG